MGACGYAAAIRGNGRDTQEAGRVIWRRNHKCLMSVKDSIGQNTIYFALKQPKHTPHNSVYRASGRRKTAQATRPLLAEKVGSYSKWMFSIDHAN